MDSCFRGSGPLDVELSNVDVEGLPMLEATSPDSDTRTQSLTVEGRHG